MLHSSAVTLLCSLIGVACLGQEAPQNQTIRDPFWPVGFRPSPKEEIKKVVEGPVSWPALKLKGITRDAKGRYLAILEGVGVVATGETIALQEGSLIYRWKVNAVDSNGASCVKMDVIPASPPLNKDKEQGKTP